MLQRDLWVSSKEKATFGVCAKLRFEALSSSFSKKRKRENEKIKGKLVSLLCWHYRCPGRACGEPRH